MAKITLIGAGSVVFAKTLIGDILSYPELSGSEISLMDIDSERLDMIAALARKMVEEQGTGAKVEATLDRRQALDGADYVIIMIQVGGVEAFSKDIEIPLAYGIKQCVGDTLGPGGVMRALRTIPVLLDICKDISELCPDAQLINYSNPMAMNCWALNAATQVKNVGLCHSVQGTAKQLAGYVGVPLEEIDYWVAGINHMAWFLRFARSGEDLYPRLREAMDDPAVYEKDTVRFEIMRHFDYFVSESSGHMSEYIPYIRKRDDLIEKFCRAGFGGETAVYLRWCKESWQEHYDKIKGQIEGSAPLEVKRSMEYSIQIIHSMETDTKRRVNANVRNDGIITNLRAGCCVEVPCLVDRTGVHPCHVGELPPQLAALNMSNIAVQELTAGAALQKDQRMVFHAIAADPLTAAQLSLDEIQEMTGELMDASKPWLRWD
jgi:alpha-galactosidase